MRILFITENFPPEVNAGASRTYEHCKEWAKSGAEVIVLTCTPNFPQGRVYNGYKNAFFKSEWKDGIRIVRVWTYITRNEGFLRRSLDFFSFAITSFLAGLFLKADIVVATSPQFFTTFSACALSKFKRIPWVFELRDLWPESIKAVGAMKEGPLIRFLEKIEHFLYRDATHIVVVTKVFKSRLIQLGINELKISIVTNGVELDQFFQRQKDKSLLQKYKLEDRFVVGYIGTHGMAHGLELIVNWLNNIKDPTIHFLFIGDGARKEEVIRLVQEKKISNITLFNPIPKEDVPRFMSLLDVSLVPLIKSDTFKTVIPSKIFEAAAMQKPVLLGVEGIAKEIVESYSAGVCFEPENESDFIAKIKLLKSDSQFYQKSQKGCIKLSNDYDRKKLASDMLQCLKNIVNQAQLENGR